MTSLTLTAPRSDTWYARIRRAEMLDRLRIELQCEPGKIGRKRAASDNFHRTGDLK